MPIFGDFAAPKVVSVSAVEAPEQAESATNTQAMWEQPVIREATPVSKAPAIEVPQHPATVLESHAQEAPVETVETLETANQTPEEMLQQVLDQLAVPERRHLPTSTLQVEQLDSLIAAEPAPTRENRFSRGETSEIWGVKLDRVRMEETIESIEAMIVDRVPRYIITANLNYAMLLAEDPTLQAVTDQASMILADGQPFVWRSRFGAAGQLPERVAGSELIYRIAERAAQQGWRIYFLGAEPGVAQQCADALVKRYPKLQIAGVQSPPYRKQSEAEQQAQRDAIIHSHADILLVAFGQPKGERWIHQHYQELGVPVSIQVGATFDFVAGTAKRAPKMWQRFGLEWAYRMMSDPGRLVPRYMGNAWFLFLAMICDWRDFVNARYGSDNDTTNRLNRA